jgi:hypothetical protein
MTEEPVRGEDLDRLIRRAAELQFHSAEDRGGWLTTEEVLRIGTEVGLDSAHLRRALQELRAEGMRLASPLDRSLLGRLLGPSVYRVARVISGSPAALEALIVARLRDREGMEAVRRREGTSVWEPSQRWFTSLQRGVRWGGHRYDLARVQQLRVDVAPMDEGTSLVTLTLDLGGTRTSEGGAILGGLGVGAISPGLLLWTASLWPGFLTASPLGVAALVCLGAGVGGGGGWLLARNGFQARVARSLLAAEGFLDGVEMPRARLPPFREGR